MDAADVVYHLAAAVGVELIVESPVRTIETNVHATEVVLSAASKKKKPVFVASTSEVYGKSAALPFREDGDLLLGPTFKGRWSYACSKAIDEFLALAYWKERGLPTVIGRMFNTVGPRQTGRYGMVVPNFVRQALAGQPITVFGDGTQSRCFCHVHDVVRALADLMERDDLYGEVFNIGSRGGDHDRAISPRRSARSWAPTSEITYVPTTRPTRRASRTCSAACPTSRRSGRSSAGRPRSRSTRSCATSRRTSSMRPAERARRLTVRLRPDDEAYEEASRTCIAACPTSRRRQSAQAQGRTQLSALAA